MTKTLLHGFCTSGKCRSLTFPKLNSHLLELPDFSVVSGCNNSIHGKFSTSEEVKQNGV